MTTTNDEEVKDTPDPELDGVLTANDLEDPDSDDLGNAIVEDPENKPAAEEKETPAETSTEEKPAEGESEKDLSEGDEPEGQADPEEKIPKDVPGETPREKALRQELTRTRQKLRTERGQKLFGEIPAPTVQNELSDEDKQTLAAYDPQQLNDLEQAFTVLAKKHGYVRKDEFSKQTYQDTAQGTLDGWLEDHPEYDEKNDSDGLLWKRFGQEYGQYKIPQNPKDLTKIFNRIHKDIFGVETDQSGLKKVEAQKEKIKVASHSASAGTGSPKSAKSIDAETKQLVDSGALKGFDDETLKEMGLK